MLNFAATPFVFCYNKTTTSRTNTNDDRSLKFVKYVHYSVTCYVCLFCVEWSYGKTLTSMKNIPWKFWLHNTSHMFKMDKLINKIWIFYQMSDVKSLLWPIRLGKYL